MSRKRRLSSPAGQPSPGKRQAKDVVVIEDDDDDDEPLEAILAKISAQEQSEALAMRLQNESTNSIGLSSSGNATSSEPIVIDDEDDSILDSDEALARRLAAEWANEDSNAHPQPSSSQHALSSLSGPSTSSNSRTHAPIYQHSEDSAPDIQLRAHQDLFIATRQCTKCQTDISSPRGYVTYAAESLPPPSLVNLLHATCTSCKTVHCRGCFQVIDCPPGCKGKNAPCKAMTCCPEIRAIALLEALGGFDRQYLGEQETSDTRSKEAAARYRQVQGASVGPGGTGYGTGVYNAGSGYANAPDEFDEYYTKKTGRGRGRGKQKVLPFVPPSNAAALAAHWDVILVRALSTITSLIPSPYSEEAQVYDMLPHPSIAQLLAVSQLPELLASLLRNDSITDWTARSDLYNAMLALLRRIADCELTLEVLINERYELANSCGVEEWMWGNGEINWTTSSDGKPVKANALRTYFQKLTKQSEAFLAGASQLLEADEGEDDAEIENTVQSVSLCGEIIAARNDLERAMKVLSKRPAAAATVEETTVIESSSPKQGKGKGKGKSGSKEKGPDPSIALERRYAQECERLAFEHIAFPTMAGNYISYNYAPQLRDTANATRNPKNRLHLIKELAVTATSLPPGVWVRVDEVRNDAIKIMIAGPEGTPYAGGLFEFDCFIPLEYPHTPPLLHLRTTGGGSVRFNPNLYNCGKVCLSLLGTWPGRPEEQWSSKSTLLQVLVSIQSMILVELPYFNEPGYGKAVRSNAQSVAYNKNITTQTTRWAIIDWLRDEHKDSIWADVIASHFTLRKSKIRSTIEEWAKSEPRIRKYASQPSCNHPGAAYNPTGFSMALPLPSAHVYAINGNTVGGMDLLAEFERGIERVKAWGLNQDGPA